MSDTTQTLNDVLSILRDGVDFYRDAQDEVKDVHLVSLFGRIMKEKEEFASDLSAEIALRGDEPEGDGTFVGSIRQAYAKLRAAFSSTNKAFVSELEEHEDRILDKVKSVLNSEDTPEATKRILRDRLSTVQILHDEMALLKKAMSA